MTKLEYEKCEKLMKEAIQNAELALKEYAESENHLDDANELEWEECQRKADQHYGYAEGIN